MTAQLLQSADLVGVSHLLSTSSPARVFAASPDVRRIICMTALPPVLAVVGESAVLTAEPGAMVSFASSLWCVLSDGSLRSFSIGSTPAQTASYARECYTNKWLLAYSSVMIVPGPCGTVLTVNSAGTVLARAEGVLERITMAVIDTSGNLYLFDGHGTGLALTVNGTTGAITMGDYFEPVNCVDLQAAIVDGDTLVLIAHDRRVEFDITDRTAPVLDDIRYYRAQEPTSVAVLATGYRFVAAHVPPEGFPVAWEQGPTAINGGLIVGLPEVGAMLYENPAFDEDGVSHLISSALANTVAPVVTGTPGIGNTLTCSTGTWVGWPVITYTYQWRRDGVDIAGQTASTHVIVSGDFNTAVDCMVTATDGTLATASQDSNNIAIGTPPVNTVAPVASGTASSGSTLSCTTGTWTGTATISYTYQWRRNGSNISLATASTYLLVDADGGTSVDCMVTGTNVYGNSSQDSNNISVAAAAPVAGYARWYDANQIVGKNDGDKVSTWADLSGNGIDLTQGTDARRPVYRTNVMNGKPALQFTAADFTVIERTLGAFFTTAAKTVFMVIKSLAAPVDIANYQTVFDTGALGNTRHIVFSWTDVATPMINYDVQGGAYPGVAFSTSEALLVAMKFNGASSRIRLNGDTGRQNLTALDVAAASDAPFRLGAQYDQATSHNVDMKLAELIVYASALSDGDFATCETYLKNKYGIV